MKRSERNEIIKYSQTLTDDELEAEYYDTVYNYSLGSQTEIMYELGYDLVDIEEREQFEKFMSQKCDILEKLCFVRCIKLWQR